MKGVSDKERILTIVDKTTGEVDAHIKLPERTFGKEGWFVMFQNALAWVSGQQDMTGEQLKVMLNLISSMEYDNRIIYDREKVAQAVGIRPNHVSRAVKALKSKDIIYEDPNNKGIYKLNPYIGHKGKKEFRNNIVEFEKIMYERNK